VEVDLPLERLQQFEYQRPEPPDFDSFWATTLTEQRAVPLEPSFTKIDSELITVDVIDISFRGYGGSEVRGWLLLPAGAARPLPAVVEYLGYGSGRGHPIESLAYASAGFAHAILDTRGQGSSTRTGDTADPHGSAPSVPGFLTRGILDREEYYYRRLFVDAYRFVDVVRSHSLVDGERITATGRSQGGALTLATAGLRDDIALAVPQVVFLSAFERALQVTDANPYGELTRWLATHRTSVDEALETLAYFDAVPFARRARCPGKFSVALQDVVSPPSTVYAAYNAYGGPKDMTIWRYNGHESGGPQDILPTIHAVRDLG
jgi:cephalosporin-C deacetylase